jgi:cytochrome c
MKMKPQKGLLAAALGLALAACGTQAAPLNEDQIALIERLDALAETAPAELQEGKRVFERQCAACHGSSGGGLQTGPPLVDAVYRPAHHSDVAFYIAISQGVQAHHFNFGDMPSMPGVSQAESEAVVAYIRWLQQSVGIE